MKSERGEIVRGSDPPVVFSAQTAAGSVWRASTKLLLEAHLATGVWKTETNTLDRLPTGKIYHFKGI